MSTFQTHTGTAFRAAARDGFHISIKRGGPGGRKGPSFGESGPSETTNTFEWGICISLLPLFITAEDTGAAEREGIPLHTFFYTCASLHGGCSTAPQPGPEIIPLEWMHRLYNIGKSGFVKRKQCSVCVQAFTSSHPLRQPCTPLPLIMLKMDKMSEQVIIKAPQPTYKLQQPH